MKKQKEQKKTMCLLLDEGDVLDLIDAIGFAIIGEPYSKYTKTEYSSNYHWAIGRIKYLNQIMERLYQMLGVDVRKDKK